LRSSRRAPLSKGAFETLPTKKKKKERTPPMADKPSKSSSPQTDASELRRLKDVAKWDVEADVVVVGLGVAGGSAAIEAARAGAEVLVLERAAAGGGATAESGGLIYLGGGTPVQKACGFEDSPEEMFKYLMQAAGPADEEKVRLYCDGSLEHFDWLVELGVEFKHSFYAEKSPTPETDDGLCFSGNEGAYPFSQHAKPAPRGHKPRTEGDAGGVLMQKVIAGVEAAGVEVVADALCETLVADEAGRIVGVVARIDAEQRLVRARRGVILAAGGFIKNREMLAKHAPQFLKCNYPIGTDGDDGRGIRMGMGAGGAAIHMGEGFVSTPFYPPPDHVKGILVNEQGQRFINEDAYHGRSGDYILNHQQGVAYLIVDDEIYGPTIAFHKVLTVEESIEDLERALGMPESSLTTTVAFFNEHAAKGEDPLFHKAAAYLRPLASPPFSALSMRVTDSIFAAFTLGGLDTLPTGEVLTPDGKVVPGLYAAGRNSAGLPRWSGGYSSGMSIGGGSFFGRQAGKSAARAERS
jgi:succinate dehydrogenase/fumarate reductase flavoprotein subunit